ncbi:MAG: hypothetical protein OXH04_08905 [Acidobacteria bacterium]|nr:hypothetical protein [Acidobacteriota bacterium]
MFAKNLYRDDAVVAHAKPESLDGLVRVDPPHQFVVTRLSAGLALIVLAWLVAGTTDHSLWLHGVPAVQWDMTAPPVVDAEGRARAELVAFVSARDAEKLAPGLPVDVLPVGTPTARDAAGTVLSVSRNTGELPPRLAERTGLGAGRSFLVRIAMTAPARAAGDEGAPDVLHRLRIRLGRQSPLQFLVRQIPWGFEAAG